VSVTGKVKFFNETKGYRYRTRIGQSAQTVQGQMTSAYSLKDMPDFVRASLDPYRSVVGI